mmetsp:Transcript_3235/g.7530  ORF Transcript_3235/g.7530 Transcript_3235/m.7530 type:complete len:195 (+) Transcript_3235:1019-1603(+)
MCKVQAEAQELAMRFNRRVSQTFGGGGAQGEWQVNFADTWIYEVLDDFYEQGRGWILAEPELEGKFTKWNNNAGGLRAPLSRRGGGGGGGLGIGGAIIEEDEEEDEDEDEEEEEEEVPEAPEALAASITSGSSSEEEEEDGSDGSEASEEEAAQGAARDVRRRRWPRRHAIIGLWFPENLLLLLLLLVLVLRLP